MKAAVSGQLPAVRDDSDREPHRGVAAWLCLVATAAINLVVAMLWLGLFAWLIGRVFSDRYEWSQWLWWTPTPFALTAALLGWLLSLRRARTRARRRRRMLTWCACLISMLGYFAAVEHRLLHALTASSSVSGDVLTIAHWNMTLDNHADIPALMQSIDALNADVLSITSPPGEVRRQLMARAAEPDANLAITDAWPMLLVSRLPLTNQRLLISADGSYLTAVEVDAAERIGRSLTIMLVDLPSNPRLQRLETAGRLRAMLDERDAPVPDIAIGDFNMTRGSASIETLFPGMVDAFDVAGTGYGATFPRRFPLYHIDHTLIAASSGLMARRYEIIDAGQSRHRAQKTWIGAAQ